MTKSIKLLTVLFTLFVLSLMGVDAALAASESEWTRLYKIGEHAFFIGDYRTAQQAYGAALELLKKSGDHSPRLKFTLEKLTRSFLLDNDLKSAEPIYIQLQPLLHTGDRWARLEQVFRIDLKEMADTYERKWNRYHDQKYLEHSLELLEAATGGEDAKSVEEMVTLSHVYINHGQVKKGIDQMKRATSASEKTFGKSPTGLSDNLFRLAIDCQAQGNYKSANEVMMHLIKMANRNASPLPMGLPAFYVCLGTNMLAQEKTAQANKYFAKAIEEGAKIKSEAKKKCAKQYFAVLEQPIWSDKREDKLTLAESKFKELIAVEQAIFKGPFDSYDILTPLVDDQNRLAIKCETEQKYDRTKELELAVIKSVRESSSAASTGLPAFYFLLGMNATARGKPAESIGYYNQSITACSKIKGTKAERLAEQYLDLLVEPIWSESAQQGKLGNVESEFRLLAKAQGKISKDANYQYQAYSRLAAIVTFEYKALEVRPYLKRCIEIAERPDSRWKPELPELYMRLAIDYLARHESDKAYETFSRALKLEKDPYGDHACWVLSWWGWSAKYDRRFSLAMEKLNIALKIARALPPKKRGSKLMDALEMLSSVESSLGKQRESQALIQERSAEEKLQREIGCKFEPLPKRYRVFFLKETNKTID